MSWKMPVAAEPNRQPASGLFLGGKAAAEGSNQRLGSRGADIIAVLAQRAAWAISKKMSEHAESVWSPYLPLYRQLRSTG